jgi:protoporphyrinogen oxidase
MTAPDGERWAVIGGGILGMTLALRLAQRGLSVTLIERAEQLGGLAGAWRLGDVVWDRHYHVTLLSDSYTRAILKDLGLEHDMRWVPTRTGFYTDGRLHSMSSVLEFLLFPPLGLIGKARLAGTILHASRLTDWKPLERIPVEDWLRAWSGDRTFEKIWLPLLRAKLGEAYTKTSAAFIWATIQRMYAARRAGLKQEQFGYLPGGYARTLEAFRRRLEEAGVHLFLGMNVATVTQEQGGEVKLEMAGGTRIRFDRVVLTVPTPIAARLCPGISEREQTLLEQVEYQGIVCASMLLKKPLADFYITNITDSWVPFTAVIEMSALVDREQFGGNALVYLPRYLASNDPGFDIPDHEWGERAVETLSGMYPDFDPQDVLAFQVSRERYVYALPTLGYSERVPPMRTSLPGVFLVNSAQIVNGTLNVNQTVRLAEESVEGLLSAAPGQEAGSVPRQGPR